MRQAIGPPAAGRPGPHEHRQPSEACPMHICTTTYGYPIAEPFNDTVKAVQQEFSVPRRFSVVAVPQNDGLNRTGQSPIRTHVQYVQFSPGACNSFSDSSAPTGPTPSDSDTRCCHETCGHSRLTCDSGRAGARKDSGSPFRDHECCEAEGPAAFTCLLNLTGEVPAEERSCQRAEAVD